MTHKIYMQHFKNNLQGEFSVSSQLSTLPRRAEGLLVPGEVSWEKYFPMISTTLSSSDKRSRAVVYTILIPVLASPVSPPGVWCVSSPCI